MKAPVFSKGYTAKGTLYIPYAEIREPFYAWYDAQSGNSRIDYYGGDYTNQQFCNCKNSGFTQFVLYYFSCKI